MRPQLGRRGILYSAGIIFNRIVPAWIFRFRVFDIVQLHLPHREFIKNHDVPDVATKRSTNEFDRRAAMNVTKTGVSQETLDRPNVQGWIATIDGRPVGGLWLTEKEFKEEDLALHYHLQSV